MHNVPACCSVCIARIRLCRSVSSEHICDPTARARDAAPRDLHGGIRPSGGLDSGITAVELPHSAAADDRPAALQRK